MHKLLHDIVQKTVDASRLTDVEKGELQKELTVHIADHARELELQGCSEEKVITEIQRAFGDAQHVGEQLFLVHRRFEKIPWVGPLFYYQPVRLAVQVLIGDILVLVTGIGVLMSFSITGIVEIFGDDAAEPILFSSIALLPIMQGVWLGHRAVSVKNFFAVIALSLVPFFLISYIELLRMFLQWNVPTYTNMDWVIPTLVFFHTLFLLVGGAAHVLYVKIHHKIHHAKK